MNLIKRVLIWFWKDWLMMGSKPSQPNSAMPPRSSAVPPAAGAATSNYDHVERRHTLFKKAGPNDVITENEEKHSQYDGAQESDITKTKIITGSGTIIKPSQAKGICSTCGFIDKELERCFVCGSLLCPLCKQEFKSETGEIKTVCETHQKELIENFNTWKYFTAKQNGVGS